MEAVDVFLSHKIRISVLLLVSLLFTYLMSVQVWADVAQGTVIKKQSTAAVSDSIKVVSLKSFKDCSDCPEMVVLPAGKYMMGITKADAIKEQLDNNIYDPAPYHQVALQSFALGRYDVTKKDFAKFVHETGYKLPTGCKVMTRFSGGYGLKFMLNANWQNPGFIQTDRDPVVCVSWSDAQHYVAWLNAKLSRLVSNKNSIKGLYRLPSEKQWEYAARAGTTTIRYWGDSVNAECEYANGQDIAFTKKYPLIEGTHYIYPPASCQDGFANTSPVGSFKPNLWGLYDMQGNVDQWIEESDEFPTPDRFSESATEVQQWRATHRILRGGGWSTLPWGLIVITRNVVDMDDREDGIGFRLVRDIQ